MPSATDPTIHRRGKHRRGVGLTLATISDATTGRICVDVRSWWASPLIFYRFWLVQGRILRSMIATSDGLPS